MAEYPDDVIRIAKEALGETWSAELGGTKGWLLRRDAIAEAIMAERRRPVIVVCENDFPSAVFSSTAKAVEWANGAKEKDQTSPFATRIYRHHHSFVVDANLKNTAD